MKEKDKISRREFIRSMTIIVLSGTIAACTPELEKLVTNEPIPTWEDIPASSEPQPTVVSEPTSIVERGPDVTSSLAGEYPDNLTVKYVKEQLGKGGELPPGFHEDPDVINLLNIKKSWVRNAGQNVDDPEGLGYVNLEILSWGEGDNFRWDVVPKDKLGRIVGWLQIRDDTIDTGWRFAESPMWEPGFDPATTQFRFGMPNKLDFDNSFTVIQAMEEFKVLVELDVNGEPIRMLNTKLQEVQWLKGAEPLDLSTGDNVHDFMMGVGDYSDEELGRTLFQSGIPGVDSDLGLLGRVNHVFTVQGIVLNTEIKGGDVLVHFGTKNFKDEKVVIVLRNTPDFFRLFNWGGTMVAFYNSRVNSSSVSNYDHANDILTKSVEELYEQIYTRVGEPMLMNFGIGESFEGYFEVFRERVLDNGGTVEDYQAIESMIRANWEKGNLLISYLKKSQAGWGTDADTSSSLPLVNSTGGISDVDLEKTMPMGNVVFLLDH